MVKLMDEIKDLEVAGNAGELVNGMKDAGFQAGNLAEAVELIGKMKKEGLMI